MRSKNIPARDPKQCGGSGRIINVDDDDDDDDVEDDDVEEEDRSQDLGPHSARACAIEMHVNISQEPLYTEIYRGKCRGPEPRPTLCASLCSRNAHQHFTRASLYGSLQKKCRGPERRSTLCASLRSRNAHQHFTRATATLNGNLQEKGQLEHPDQAPAFTITVRTPQCGHTVWGTIFIYRYRLDNWANWAIFHG